MAKNFLRDGQSIAAAKKLRLRSPRAESGRSRPRSPGKFMGDAILIKTDFCIRRIVRGKFDRCDFTKIGLHFESQLRI